MYPNLYKVLVGTEINLYNIHWNGTFIVVHFVITW